MVVVIVKVFRIGSEGASAHASHTAGKNKSQPHSRVTKGSTDVRSVFELGFLGCTSKVTPPKCFRNIAHI